MAQGAFLVHNEGRPRDIVFSLMAEGGNVPEDQLRLRDDIDKTLTVLKGLFPPEHPRFNEYYTPLLNLARVGLVGEHASPELAARALESLKNDVTASEAGRIKNRYMKQLGIKALWAGGPLAAAGAILRWCQDTQEAACVLFVLAGCMAGVWLSFGARKAILRFEDLHIPEEDRMEPFVRLIFAGLLTLIIALLFSLKAVVVTMGAVSTDQVTSDFRVAILVGMLCGFSEQVLSTRVAKQAGMLLEFGG